MTRAVVFDLDGTLTVPILDFDAIRAEIGIEHGPILEAMAEMTGARRKAAQCVVDRHEEAAAEAACLRDGVHETIDALRESGFSIGVLTRNARKWCELVLDRCGVIVDAVRCREDGVVKPSPDGVLALCELFDANPADCWMVGDYLFDVQAGHRAGAKTVLIIGDEVVPEYANQADHVIRRMPELLPIVNGCDDS
jgi:HAD superfamily hydrolase (TIGR01509 family)